MEVRFFPRELKQFWSLYSYGGDRATFFYAPNVGSVKGICLHQQMRAAMYKCMNFIGDYPNGTRLSVVILESDGTWDDAQRSWIDAHKGKLVQGTVECEGTCPYFRPDGCEPDKPCRLLLSDDEISISTSI